MRWPEVACLVPTAERTAAPSRGAVLGTVFVVALMTGCSTPAPSPVAPAQPPVAVIDAVPAVRPEPPLLLVDDLQRLRALPGPELYAETQRLLATSEPRAQLKAASALAQPQHPARDEARAVSLAEEVARAGDAPPALRDLAAVVALWLDELRRAEASGRRAQTKAREDEARLALTEARLRDMEKRAQEAEKKLEALRAIERDLSGRGAGNGRP
jgi:hypothetical protein